MSATNYKFVDCWHELMKASCSRTCAVVGGVLTVASIVDSVVFATSKKLKKGGVSVTAVAPGYGNGKLL